MILTWKLKSKGQFKIIEASIATILLILILSMLLRLAPKIPEVEFLDLKLKILNALQTFDFNNELRDLAYSNQTQAIKQKLRAYIPIQFDYEVVVCDNSCKIQARGKEVYSTSYILSTDLKNFLTKEVIVYAWKA